MMLLSFVRLINPRVLPSSVVAIIVTVLVLVVVVFCGCLIPAVDSLLGAQHPFLQACARGTLVEVTLSKVVYVLFIVKA